VKSDLVNATVVEKRETPPGVGGVGPGILSQGEYLLFILDFIERLVKILEQKQP